MFCYITHRYSHQLLYCTKLSLPSVHSAYSHSQPPLIHRSNISFELSTNSLCSFAQFFSVSPSPSPSVMNIFHSTPRLNQFVWNSLVRTVRAVQAVWVIAERVTGKWNGTSCSWYRRRKDKLFETEHDDTLWVQLLFVRIRAIYVYSGLNKHRHCYKLQTELPTKLHCDTSLHVNWKTAWTLNQSLK